MKIAIIQPRTSYHVAGSEKVSLKHAEFLSSLGHTIELYTTKIPKARETFLFKEFINKKLNNCSILQFDISKSLSSKISQAHPLRSHANWAIESSLFSETIYIELEKSKPDVILSYYLPDTVFMPPKIPSVIYLSGYPATPIPSYTILIQSCFAAISISTIVFKKWADELNKVPYKYFLPTGVEYPVSIKEIAKKKAKYNLVYAGRLIERKGVLTLIEAFRILSEKNSDVHLWILGEGKLGEKLDKLIIEYNLTDKVTRTGLVENPGDYFSFSDVCIFPSEYGDGLMGTVLESMAAGKAVITTQNSGSEDVIINNQNGILIKPKSISALVNSITDLLADNSRRIHLGAMASKFVRENLTWQKHALKLSLILQEVVNNYNQKSSS